MPNNLISYDIQCPFYLSERKLSISCEDSPPRKNRRKEGRIKSIINEVEQGGHDAILKMKRNPAAMRAWSKRA